VDSERPCAVLQYADDTMIVMRGEIADMHALKDILHKINYGKSTMVSIHMDSDEAT
jgi:hypothetical protein